MGDPHIGGYPYSPAISCKRRFSWTDGDDVSGVMAAAPMTSSNGGTL